MKRLLYTFNNVSVRWVSSPNRCAALFSTKFFFLIFLFFFKSGDFDGFGVIFLHRSRLVSFSFFISAGWSSRIDPVMTRFHHPLCCSICPLSLPLPPPFLPLKTKYSIALILMSISTRTLISCWICRVTIALLHFTGSNWKLTGSWLEVNRNCNLLRLGSG